MKTALKKMLPFKSYRAPQKAFLSHILVQQAGGEGRVEEDRGRGRGRACVMCVLMRASVCDCACGRGVSRL